jgi:NAD(P)H dehydrogenase (quinone)
MNKSESRLRLLMRTKLCAKLYRSYSVALWLICRTSGLPLPAHVTLHGIRRWHVNSAGMIAGSPVYFGVMAADLKRVFDEFVGVRKQMENKVGAAFATPGFWAGGNETTVISIIQCLLIYGMIIVGDPMSATGHYGATSVAAPDDKASDIARKLGARVAELCKKLGG